MALYRILRLQRGYVLALALVALPGALAQLTLPLISDSAFHLIPGEDILAQQLSTWGIKIGPVSLDLKVPVLQEVLDRRTEAVPDRRRSRGGRRLAGQRGLDLDIGVGIGAELGIGPPSDSLGGTAAGSASGSAGATGSATPGPASITDGADPMISGFSIPGSPKSGWGDADNVAKGEQGDTEWYTYISLGSPPQSIPVLPDTGSSDLFIFGPTCATCSLWNHTAFHPVSSPSYQNYSSPWQFYYADGSAAEGDAGCDIATLGSDSAISVSVPFALTDQVKGSSFARSARSGVLGLGLDGMSTMSVPSQMKEGGMTLLSRLVKSGAMDESVLSLRLEKGVQKHGVVTKEGQGAYVFGGIEDEYIAGGRLGLSWVPVTSANYWGFSLDDISVGIDSVLLGDTATSRRAIIDTGTTLIFSSDTAAAAFHTRIPGAWHDPASDIWYIPCSTSYPATQNLFFTIGERRYGVPVEDLAWKASSTYAGRCVSGVQGGMPYFTVLGDVFIKNHYVVLSYGSSSEDNIQVGLGDRIDVDPIL